MNDEGERSNYASVSVISSEKLLENLLSKFEKEMYEDWERFQERRKIQRLQNRMSLMFEDDVEINIERERERTRGFEKALDKITDTQFKNRREQIEAIRELTGVYLSN